jgi:lipopolysaccharide transport system permease protein
MDTSTIQKRDGSKLKEIIYTPDSQLRNPGVLVREMIADIARSRGLAWRLFVRNISAQYRQSLLGYFWAFLPPLFTMAVWVFLNSQKIINVEDPGMPYPVFVLTGTVLWQTFVDAINSPLKVVNESKGMLAKINFPHEALVLAGLGEVLFNFAIRILLLVGIFIWFRVSVPATLPLALPGVLALIALGLMFGVLLTPPGVLYGDVGRGITILTQFWFFLTPVIYPMPKEGIAALLTQLNPVTPVLLTTREWLTLGSASQLTGFWIVSGFSIIFLLFGWLLYRIAMPHLIARMSA